MGELGDPGQLLPEGPVTFDESYELCRQFNKRHATTYYCSTKVLPKIKQHHVHALYAFARYADDIVALTSLIQIVNSYHELGDTERARTAARRVQIKLAQLPAAAFDESQATFPREAWERWLALRPQMGATEQKVHG